MRILIMFALFFLSIMLMALSAILLMLWINVSLADQGMYAGLSIFLSLVLSVITGAILYASRNMARVSLWIVTTTMAAALFASFAAVIHIDFSYDDNVGMLACVLGILNCGTFAAVIAYRTRTSR